MIEASTVKVSTMSDDTLRIVLDISPEHAQEAFALFGQRGSPCVIARLTQEASIASRRAETIAADTCSSAEKEKPKGGVLARLSGQFRNDVKFWEWAGVNSRNDAVEFIHKGCGIKSCIELDHNNAAAEIFHRNIREPYRDYLAQESV